MKEKGFTLIELLAVLLILPILLIIAYPAVNHFLEKTELQYYDNLEKNVRLAAIDFAQDNKNFLPSGIGSYRRISLEQIAKYSEIEQITDKSGNKCEDGYVVIQKKDTADYEYTSCITCGNYKTVNPECEKDDSKYMINYILRHNDQNGQSYEEGTWSSTNIYQEFTNNELYGVRVDTYQRQLDNGVWEDFSGNSFILEKTRNVCVRAIDIDGNISTPRCYDVRIDKNPITITAVTQTSGRVLKTSSMQDYFSSLFTFGIFGESGGEIKCQLEDRIVYKNTNSLVSIDEKIEDLVTVEGNNTVSCTSITGSGITITASNNLDVVDSNEKTFNQDSEATIYVSGWYQLTASGAQGSNSGGKGGTIAGKIYLNKGDKVAFNIGKSGEGGAGYNGSGGGSTIIKKGNANLVIGAGGGGGAGGGAGGSGTSAGGITPASTKKQTYSSISDESGGESGAGGLNGSGGGRSNDRIYTDSCNSGSNTCQSGYNQVWNSCATGNPQECVGGYNQVWNNCVSGSANECVGGTVTTSNCISCQCSLYKTCQHKNCGTASSSTEIIRVLQTDNCSSYESQTSSGYTSCTKTSNTLCECTTYTYASCQTSGCGSETVNDCGRCAGKNSFQCLQYESYWDNCASTTNTCQGGYVNGSWNNCLTTKNTCQGGYVNGSWNDCLTGSNTCNSESITISGVAGDGGTSSVGVLVTQIFKTDGNVSGNGNAKIKFLNF